MAITDISISEELMTGAPSIKYRGNEGPKSPQEMQQMMAGSDRYFQILTSDVSVRDSRFTCLIFFWGGNFQRVYCFLKC